MMSRSAPSFWHEGVRINKPLVILVGAIVSEIFSHSRAWLQLRNYINGTTEVRASDCSAVQELI